VSDEDIDYLIWESNWSWYASPQEREQDERLATLAGSYLDTYIIKVTTPASVRAIRVKALYPGQAVLLALDAVGVTVEFLQSFSGSLIPEQ
jgi:hypothetical protein